MGGGHYHFPAFTCIDGHGEVQLNLEGICQRRPDVPHLPESS